MGRSTSYTPRQKRLAKKYENTPNTAVFGRFHLFAYLLPGTGYVTLDLTLDYVDTNGVATAPPVTLRTIQPIAH